MSISIYMKGDYEEFHALKVAKKQSQFYSFIVLRSGYCVGRIASWLCHSCENGNPDLLVVLDSASSAE